MNRVETRVDLRLDLSGAEEHLGGGEVDRIRQRLAGRLDGEGNLQVVCQEHREQAANLQTALQRMVRLLDGALERRRPRRPTRPTRASRERRLSEKKRRGEVKRWRSRPPE